MISKSNPGLYNSKDHIPPETAFALGTQCVEKVKKQHEIDMPNAGHVHRDAPTQMGLRSGGI